MRQSSKRFKVVAAGEIEISKSASALTARNVGFSFGISWGEHGYAGGVLSRREAKKLAEYILKTLSECKESEKEVIKRVYKEL